MRLIRALFLAGLCSTAACSAPNPQDIVARLPDGRKLSFLCTGTGAPTILLESGYGGGAHGWPAVMEPLSKRYRVCGYDRAGLGQSDPGPLPRDGTAIARDLDMGLRAAKIVGPFVLVGHSTGGLYVRHLLLRRRGDVVGMVLVDSSIPEQQRRFEAVFGPGAGTLQPLIDGAAACLAAATAGQPGSAQCGTDPAKSRAARWAMAKSELDTLFGKTSTRLDHDDRVIGALPLIVLTAGKTYDGPAEAFWVDLHAELAHRSTQGQMRVIGESGHGMMWEAPAAIVQAVEDVVAQAQAQ